MRPPFRTASSSSRCRRSVAATAASPAEHVRERLLRRSEELSRLLVAVGDDHIRADHRIRLAQLVRGLESLAVGRERGQERVGREMRCERIRQPKHGRQLRAVETRAEDPKRHFVPAPGVARTQPDREPGQRDSAATRSPPPGRCPRSTGRGAAQGPLTGRCPAPGRGRGRCGRDGATRGCRTARRSQSARGWGA